jgi:hypothetical protein
MPGNQNDETEGAVGEDEENPRRESSPTHMEEEGEK